LKKLNVWSNKKITTIPLGIVDTLEELHAGLHCGIDDKALIGLTKLNKLNSDDNPKITKRSFGIIKI
jgi:hypothetical protein